MTRSPATDQQAEIDRLRAAIAAIQRATVDGKVCDDVAWFDEITTLYDFCDQTLRSPATSEQQWQPIESAPQGDDDFFLVCGVGDERNPFVVRGSILKATRNWRTPSHLDLHWLTHWMPLPEPPR